MRVAAPRRRDPARLRAGFFERQTFTLQKVPDRDMAHFDVALGKLSGQGALRIQYALKADGIVFKYDPS